MFRVVIGAALVFMGLYIVMMSSIGIDMLGGLIILVDGSHLLFHGVTNLYGKR